MSLNNSSPHHLYLQQPPPSSSSYEDSWEELAFAEDAAGALGGCIWPPRSYSCTFCRREFRSAQALGGHMNVHRRDRARLKQSPTTPDPPISLQQVPDPPSSVGYQFQLNLCRQIPTPRCHFPCANGSPNPSPDPPPASSPARVSANSNSCCEKSFFPSVAEEEEINRKRPPHGSVSAVGMQEDIYKCMIVNRCSNPRTDLSAVSLNLVLPPSSQSKASSDCGEAAGKDEEAAAIATRFKRKRIEENTTSTGLPFKLRPGLNSMPGRRDEAVFEMMKSKNHNPPCFREELDLELRLGDRPPKVKSI